MIIGTIETPDQIKKEKEPKIQTEIGFNKNRRNIIRNTNYNMNTLKDNNIEKFDKLTIQFMQLSDEPVDIKKLTESFQNIKDDNKKNKNNKTNKTDYKPIKTHCISRSLDIDILQPMKLEEKKVNNLVNYNSGTFLTDKITFTDNDKIDQYKENNTFNDSYNENAIFYQETEPIVNNTENNQTTNQDLNSVGFESVSELKHSIPVNFDKLVVNPNYKNEQKTIDPLFFIINGEKPIRKNRIINFRTNPALLTTFNKDLKPQFKLYKGVEKMIKIEQEFEELLTKNRKRSLFHDSQEKINFNENCFNKVAENKTKLNFDLKKTIFNDPSTFTEDKYKILKDMKRNELMNRSLGRGIFSCNKLYDDEKRAYSIKERTDFQKYCGNTRNRLSINLRTNAYYDEDKKKSLVDAQDIINRNYLKKYIDNSPNIISYRKKIGFSEMDMRRINEMNKNIEILSKPKYSSNRIRDKFMDNKLDQLLKKADIDYTKPISYLVSGANLSMHNNDDFN